MGQVNLNRNNWLFRLVSFVYNSGNELDTDGCKLGWKILFLPLVLVFSWPSLIISKLVDDEAEVLVYIIIGSFLQFLGLGLGSLAKYSWFGSYYIGWDAILIIPMGVAAIVIVVYLLFKLIVALNDLKERWKDKKSSRTIYDEDGNCINPKKKKEWFLVTWFKAQKEKSCPKINWYE